MQKTGEYAREQILRAWEGVGLEAGEVNIRLAKRIFIATRALSPQKIKHGS